MTFTTVLTLISFIANSDLCYDNYVEFQAVNYRVAQLAKEHMVISDLCISFKFLIKMYLNNIVIFFFF